MNLGPCTRHRVLSKSASRFHNGQLEERRRSSGRRYPLLNLRVDEHTLWSLIYLRPLQACFTNNRGINQGSDRLQKTVSFGHVPSKEQKPYSEVLKHKAVEEVGIGISQVAEIDVFLDRGGF